MINLRSKIYTAKILLLKQAELENKSVTFASLGVDFRLSQEDLMAFDKV